MTSKSIRANPRRCQTGATLRTLAAASCAVSRRQARDFRSSRTRRPSDHRARRRDRGPLYWGGLNTILPHVAPITRKPSARNGVESAYSEFCVAGPAQPLTNGAVRPWAGQRTLGPSSRRGSRSHARRDRRSRCPSYIASRATRGSPMETTAERRPATDRPSAWHACSARPRSSRGSGSAWLASQAGRSPANARAVAFE